MGWRGHANKPHVGQLAFASAPRQVLKFRANREKMAIEFLGQEPLMITPFSLVANNHE